MEKTNKMSKKSSSSYQYLKNSQTVIGVQHRELIDSETGEVIEVNQIIKRVLGAKQFWKIYLIDFLQVLGGFEFKQLDVLIYILENTNSSDNLYIGTFRKTAEKAGVSLDTVARTLKLLQQKKFIKKIQSGVYQISPSIMLKGSESKRDLLLKYQIDNEKPTKKTKKKE